MDTQPGFRMASGSWPAGVRGGAVALLVVSFAVAGAAGDSACRRICDLDPTEGAGTCAAGFACGAGTGAGAHEEPERARTQRIEP